MLTLLRNWYLRHFSKPGTVEFAIVLIVCFLIVYYLMWLVGPIVIAICIAYILDFFVVYLEKKLNFKRNFASIIVMTSFIAIALMLLILVVPLIIKQAAEFYNTILILGDNVAGALHLEQNTGKDAKNIDALIAQNIYYIIESMPDPLPSMLTEESFGQYITQIRTAAMAFLAGLMRNNLMPSVINVFTFLLYLVVVPIFTFLMLYNKYSIKNNIKTYILPQNQNIINQFWPRLNSQIQGYIRGKILHIIIITIVNTLAFSLFNLNYAFLLGLGVGLSVVIPYVGAVIIVVPVISIALFQFGLSSTFAWLLIVYTIIQLVDSNVLTPLLFSKTSNLDALSILTAILIFGGLWGFWGVFFAIPLATFIKTIITQWPSSNKDSPKTLVNKGQ